MESSVAKLLNDNSTQIKSQFKDMGQQVSQRLNRLPESAGKRLANVTASALDEEQKIVASDFENSLKYSMDSLADLLAKVAPAAIISNDFLTLISYAKSATAGQDVVYAIYLKPDGKPLSRYIDKKNAKIKEYIETGSGKKIDKVLSASKSDPGVIVIEKPVMLDEKVLGSLRLCISKDSMNKKLGDMGQRFSKLIQSNNIEVSQILNSESEKVVQRFSTGLQEITSGNAKAVQKIETEITRTIQEMGKKVRLVLIILGLVSITIIAVVTFFMISRIAGKMQKVAENIDDGASQVSEASGQVAGSSQSLAAGSAEQAASIEETSSSLEELSSMTSQNADNAGQADNLMKEANQVAAQANDSMQALTVSMGDIANASEETSKIIKTIDEIAFQTNLLALNAAVEAARAGEAGAGFAVVADEVRNLAMRAADAAKNTAELIAGTVKKVTDGTTLVTQTNEAFTSVVQIATKVGDLVSEIAAASNEQAKGISQINTAVTEMEKVTQQNAAGAEESASASEEMNAHAEQMKTMVRELLAFIKGTGNIAGAQSVVKVAASDLNTPHKRSTQIRAQAVHGRSETDSAKLIPFDEDDFKDF
ncbi:MAG: hypothetical protein JEZ11_10270 [Desulfobacterales bacterium]|nr:hypothetical protein [Desulfobacterales bacterium]